MNDTSIDFEQTDEDVLAVTISDEALEASVGRVPDPYKSVILQYGC